MFIHFLVNFRWLWLDTSNDVVLKFRRTLKTINSCVKYRQNQHELRRGCDVELQNTDLMIRGYDRCVTMSRFPLFTQDTVVRWDRKFTELDAESD
uniref:Secreted protein n=1 Tax=Caenorhabditis tropicalis TaxID=1561998 RepID=A0A1I7TTY8_9PELO